MFSLGAVLVGFLAYANTAQASPVLPNERRQVSSSTSTSPTVSIQYAQVVGTASAGVDTFNGMLNILANVASANMDIAIPFAQPPVNDLRLRPPQAITTNLGTVIATGTPTACPQFKQALPTSGLSSAEAGLLLGSALGQAVVASGPEGEDCLTLNVQRPSTAAAGSNLPVALWIYGGGFEFGSTQGQDASILIQNSIAVNKPIVFAQMNYRLNGFGFLPGQEIMQSGNGNIGLLDQRMAIEWVADNIAAFGGDPSKVTIFGESAGSISVFDQMALYNGNYTYKNKPLFRGAIMDSGASVPADPLNCAKGQVVYDAVVQAANCSQASDTLSCLRTAPYDTFSAAVQSVPGIFSYNSVALSFLPRPDGLVLTKSPDVLAIEGKYAAVPFIIGDQEDEGTVFSLTMSNITNTAELVSYLKTYFFHSATTKQIEGLVKTYPDSPPPGSPFNTGEANEFYPEYKRVAALLGDLSFTLLRRAFLTVTHKAKPHVPTWSYLATYDYGTPLLGTYHSTDVSRVFGSSTGGQTENTTQAYYLSFINTLNPNTNTATPQSVPGFTSWPQWSLNHELLEFGTLGTDLLPDTFRQKSYKYISQFIGKKTFHV